MKTADPSRTLLEWVLKAFPDTPKKRAKQWIAAGRISVGGRVMNKAGERLADPGGRLKLLGRHATEQSAHAVDAPISVHPQLTILHLDASLAVVNKSAGLLSLPVKNRMVSALGILRDFLKGNIGARGSKKMRPPAAYKTLLPLPVHRLDQYTSGLLCFAMNPKARAKLIEQFRGHSAKRQYVAFADGRPQAARGTWRHRLSLSDDERRQEIVSEKDSPSGKTLEAVTHYEVLEEFEIAVGREKRPITKLRFWLETGCRHQIRIQASEEGLPIIGDRTYHPLYRSSARPPPIPFPRQALHAELLTLAHPDRPDGGSVAGARDGAGATARPKEKMTWTAPMPDDLRRLEAALKNRLPSGPAFR